jgi:hypothetical protein
VITGTDRKTRTVHENNKIKVTLKYFKKGIPIQKQYRLRDRYTTVNLLLLS